MSPFAILWPTFALVALIMVVWFTLVIQRMAHLKRQPATREDFASGSAADRYFTPVQLPANNLANLFEMPVLYFALVPLLLITAHVNGAQVLLAWIFVVARVVHSFMHIGPRRVRPRFYAYAVSVAALFAMWIGFGIDMAVFANQYREAIGAVAASPQP